MSVLDFVGHLGEKGEEGLADPVVNLIGGTNESMSLWVMSGDST